MNAPSGKLVVRTGQQASPAKMFAGQAGALRPGHEGTKQTDTRIGDLAAPYGEIERLCRAGNFRAAVDLADRFVALLIEEALGADHPTLLPFSTFSPNSIAPGPLCGRQRAHQALAIDPLRNRTTLASRYIIADPWSAETGHEIGRSSQATCYKRPRAVVRGRYNGACRMCRSGQHDQPTG